MPVKGSSVWEWLYQELACMEPRDVLTITKSELDKTSNQGRDNITSRFKKKTGISMGYITADNGDMIFIRLDSRE